MFLRWLHNRLIRPGTKNEDVKRREHILNVLLIASIFLLGVASLASVIDYLRLPEYRGMSPLVVSLIFIFFLILYFLFRIGFLVVVAYIHTGIYFVLATYMIYRWGVELPSALLFYILIIIISGILISIRSAFILSVMSSLSTLIIGYLQINHIIQPDLYWKTEFLTFSDIAIISVIFFIIAIVSWISNREIEKSLFRARKSETELKAERDMLEIKVEERTRELKKIQLEKMIQLSRFAKLGKLSSGLFHDLVNPLTAMVLNMKELKKECHQEDDFKQIENRLNSAIKASDRMRDFINSVRKQFVNRETKRIFSLNREVRDAISLLDFYAKKNMVEIIFLVNKDIQTFGDPIKFNQVLTNLISNSIDSFQPPVTNKIDCRIKIYLEQSGESISLSVIDNGKGISKNIHHKIFEPFFTTKKSQDNVGIGLYLVKSIVENDFNGKIILKSTEGKGSTFTVTFNKKIG